MLGFHVQPQSVVCIPKSSRFSVGAPMRYCGCKACLLIEQSTFTRFCWPKSKSVFWHSTVADLIICYFSFVFYEVQIAALSLKLVGFHEFQHLLHDRYYYAAIFFFTYTYRFFIVSANACGRVKILPFKAILSITCHAITVYSIGGTVLLYTLTKPTIH